MKRYLSIGVIIVGIAVILGLFYKIVPMNKIDMFNLTERPYGNEQEAITLHFLHWSPIPEKIFKDFSEKHPNIKVEFEQFGMQQYPGVQKARMSSGEGVDIMGVMESDYDSFVDKGNLLKLTGKSYLNNYREEVIQALADLHPNGEIYCLPYKSWVLGIWYNKILFNKYNVRIPKNYKEFLEVCSILKSNGIAPMVLGCRDEWISSYIFNLRIWHASETDNDWFRGLGSGKVRWTDKKIIRAFEETKDFIDKDYLLKDSINLTYYQAFSEFINGRSAMCLMGDWSTDLCEPGIEKVCDLGVFPIPFNDTGSIKMVPGAKAGMLLGIFSETPFEKEAQLLLEYFSKPEVAQVYSEQTKSNSPVKGVRNNQIKYNDLWEPLQKMKMMTPLNTVLDHEVQDKLSKCAKELIINAKTPYKIAEELAELQEALKLNTYP
jgi:ABC-type glycerol-3-phosphate transport system substrate-binding protein